MRNSVWTSLLPTIVVVVIGVIAVSAIWCSVATFVHRVGVVSDLAFGTVQTDKTDTK